MNTEEEARNIRCCGPEGCGCRRKPTNDDDWGRYCIASECMAWRWDEEQRPETPTVEELEKILAGPEPVIKTLPSGELIALTFGHCGLAGKP